MNSDIPLLVRRGGRDSGRGGRSQARYGCLSDHPVCGTKVGFAEIFLMPQPPLLTKRGIGEIVPGAALGLASQRVRDCNRNC
jgi:hypothetical protein